MNELKEDCKKLLSHIKKCEFAMDMDGYTYAGVIGYVLRIPFKRMHRRHFAQIEMYVEKIRNYIIENEMDFKFEVFEELDITHMIYSADQVAAMGYKQYEHRIKYLHELQEEITKLIEVLDKNVVGVAEIC